MAQRNSPRTSLRMPHGTANALLACLALSWQLVGATRLRKPVVSGGFIFGYAQHGRDWTAGQCPTGEKQSPIDLPAPSPPVGEFQFDYTEAPLPYDIVNTGHGLSMELHGMPQGGIMFNGVWYNFVNMNMHVMSEHTFQGAQKQGELHIVHKRHDSGDLLIVAVPLQSTALPAAAAAAVPAPAPAPGLVLLRQNSSRQAPPPGMVAGAAPAGLVAAAPGPSSSYSSPPETDPNFNPTLQSLLVSAPPPDNERTKVPLGIAKGLAMNSVFEGASFFRYWGSTTTPPCAEAVTWLVRTTPMMMSDKQAQFIQDAIFSISSGYGNSRAVMPFGYRAAVIVLGAKRQMTDQSLAPGFELRTEAPTEREIRARQQAESASAVSEEAAAKIKQLEAYAKKASEMDVEAMK